MGRTAYATLNASHLVHNWHVLKSKAHASSLWAMVKANAYGHGIRSVAQRLEPYLGVSDAFGVASVDEALALRKAGIQSSIVLIEGVFEPEELHLASEYGLTVVFHTARQLAWLKACSVVSPFKAWVKVDTGMSRLGFSVNDALEAWQQVSSSVCVYGPVGIMSHLACADEKDNVKNQQQFQAFDVFRSLNTPLGICNSAALFHWPEWHGEVVRPGLALYGASPIVDASAESLDLKPVMSLHTRLIALHRVTKGQGIGYGSSFVCPKDMWIGIAAMGYGDGYPRLSSHAPVIVQGDVCRVVGRVSMDMMAIDLSFCFEKNTLVKEGDEVLLWGANHLGHLPVDVVANATNRISYDLLTSMQHRVKFTWV